MLAVHAAIAGASLVPNEQAENRHELLKAPFPKSSVTGYDGAQIHDRLDPRLRPPRHPYEPALFGVAGIEAIVCRSCLCLSSERCIGIFHSGSALFPAFPLIL